MITKGVVAVFFPAVGGLFPIIFIVIFILILGTILFRVIRGVSQWQSNNRQPILTVPATAVTKRTEVHRHTTNNSNGSVMSSNTMSYFVTFQFDSGDRVELNVHGPEYGLIAEGDIGNLTFQGTRFHSFTRT